MPPHPVPDEEQGAGRDGVVSDRSQGPDATPPRAGPAGARRREDEKAASREDTAPGGTEPEDDKAEAARQGGNKAEAARQDGAAEGPPTESATGPAPDAPGGTDHADDGVPGGAPAGAAGADSDAPSAEAGAPPELQPLATLPVRQYLEATVVPVLMRSMRRIAEDRPEDPLSALADILAEHVAAVKRARTA